MSRKTLFHIFFYQVVHEQQIARLVASAVCLREVFLYRAGSWAENPAQQELLLTESNLSEEVVEHSSASLSTVLQHCQLQCVLIGD